LRAAEPDQPVRALAIVVGVLIGGAFVGQAIGLAIGAHFHRLLPPGPLRTIDRGLGAVAGALAVLVALWALLPAMSGVTGWPSRRIQAGSGFAAGTDLVVTNAHVVAGESSTTVLRPDGRQLPAIVALFDPDRDLAVLRVRGLGETPLGVAGAAPGSVGAVFGH